MRRTYKFSDPKYSINFDMHIRTNTHYSNILQCFVKDIKDCYPTKRNITVRQIEFCTDVILANLLKAYETPFHPYVAVSLNSKDYKKSRYNPPDLGYDNFIKVFTYMKNNSHLDIRNGVYCHNGNKGYKTRIRMSDELSQKLGLDN